MATVYRVSGQQARIESATGHGWVLPIPENVASALLENGSRRVVVEIEGLVYRRALMSVTHLGQCIFLGKAIRKEARISLGQTLTVSIWSDPNPDAIDLPEEWEELMAQEPEVARVFEQFTPGLQRSLMIYITSAKRADTRVKRALHLAERIQSPDYYKYRKDS